MANVSPERLACEVCCSTGLWTNVNHLGSLLHLLKSVIFLLHHHHHHHHHVDCRTKASPIDFQPYPALSECIRCPWILLSHTPIELSVFPYCRSVPLVVHWLSVLCITCSASLHWTRMTSTRVFSIIQDARFLSLSITPIILISPVHRADLCFLSLSLVGTLVVVPHLKNISW